MQKHEMCTRDFASADFRALFTVSRLLLPFFFLLPLFCAPAGHHAQRFEFAFCSDIHYGCNNGQAILGANRAAWRRQIDSCDFLVIGGDLTCDGTEDEFRRLRSDVDSLEKPFYALPGNHDLAPDARYYRQCFGKGIGGYYIQHKGVGLLFLDVSEGGKAQVTVSDSTRWWLEKTAARVPSAMPLIVFSHFPLHPATPQYAVRRSETLFAVLDKKNVIGYFSGHYHGWLKMERGGVPFFSAGTLFPNMQNHDSSDRHGFYRVRVDGNRLVAVFVPLGIDEQAAGGESKKGNNYRICAHALLR